VPYTLSGVSSPDVLGGSLSGSVVVGANGQATINVSLANDNLTEGNETLFVTAGSATSSITVNDTSKAVVTYDLSPSSPTVDEGLSVFFTLSTTNLPAGSPVAVSVSGVSAADVQGGVLNATVYVDANGRTVIPVSLVNDLLTEGDETLTLTAGTASASVTVKDTSKAPPTYALSQNGSSVNEGSTASFTLTTTNLASGSAVPYTLSGVSAADVAGGSLSGTAYVGSNGQATINVSLANDNLTEGNETLFVTAGSATASITVNDTSKAVVTYALSPSSPTVDEGLTVFFTLSTTNLPAGSPVDVAVSGVNAADVQGGVLNATVYVDANGRAVIPVSLLNDALTEGDETLTLTAGTASASVTVNDTFKAAATYTLTSKSESVDEGSIALFELRTTNVAAGTAVPFELSGISSSDVSDGALSGILYASETGYSVIVVNLRNDAITEGNETLTVKAGTASASVNVNDTSKGVATYTLSPSSFSVDEGSTASFILQTKNLPSGSVVPYTLSGISSSDLAGGAMTGTVLVGANGQATINVSLLNDMLTEGNETLTVNAATASASIPVIDTSLSTNGKSVGQVFTWVEASTAPIIGSSSVDTFIVPMSRSGSTLTKSGNSISVINNSSMVSASLSNVERIKFADTSVAFDLDGAAGNAVQMLGAVFGKDSLLNKGVVGIAVSIYDQALMSNTQVARLALDVVLGANPSNKAVVNLLYKNLIGIAPDPLSESLFVGMINNGTYTQESITLMATNLDVNKTNINMTGLSQTGLEYTPSLF
jgi:hypothetical protein